MAHATEFGMSATSAANVLAVVGGLSIAGRVIIGGAADRMNSRLALVIVCILMAVPLFSLAVAREVWLLYLLGAIFGFAYGGLVVLQSPMVAELFGLKSHGVLLGSAVFISTLGSAIGPVVAGGIFDSTGSYSLAFLVAGLVRFIGLILALLLRATTRQGATNYSGTGAI